MLWLHGTADAVYTVANAQEEIKLFTNAKDAKLVVVQDGQHFLSFSHPKVSFRVLMLVLILAGMNFPVLTNMTGG